jgi:hypothetical protein
LPWPIDSRAPVMCRTCLYINPEPWTCRAQQDRGQGQVSHRKTACECSSLNAFHPLELRHTTG